MYQLCNELLANNNLQKNQIEQIVNKHKELKRDQTLNQKSLENVEASNIAEIDKAIELENIKTKSIIKLIEDDEQTSNFDKEINSVTNSIKKAKQTGKQWNGTFVNKGQTSLGHHPQANPMPKVQTLSKNNSNPVNPASSPDISQPSALKRVRSRNEISHP